MSLNENKFLYVLKCNSVQEMWDTLEITYGVSPSIEHDGMNTPGKEDECECFFHKCFSTLINFEHNLRTFFTNKYLRINIWNQKPDPILKSRDENVYDFQKNPRRKKSSRN